MSSHYTNLKSNLSVKGKNTSFSKRVYDKHAYNRWIEIKRKRKVESFDVLPEDVKLKFLKIKKAVHSISKLAKVAIKGHSSWLDGSWMHEAAKKEEHYEELVQLRGLIKGRSGMSDCDVKIETDNKSINGKVLKDICGFKVDIFIGKIEKEDLLIP